MKIEKVVRIVCERTGKTFKKSLRNFMNLGHTRYLKAIQDNAGHLEWLS